MLRMCSSPQVIDTVVVAVVVVVALQNQLSVAPWRLLKRLLTILLGGHDLAQVFVDVRSSCDAEKSTRKRPSTYVRK